MPEQPVKPPSDQPRVGAIRSMNVIGLIAIVLVTLAPAPRVALGAERPNVVVILSDDQAWTDYGFMGHDAIQTPNLDRLADQSLVFPRGYVTAPLCRPSLASIVTGLYPHQHGVVSNDVDPQRRAESDLPVRKRFHELPSLVRMLVDHGYSAFQAGKWWEGSWQDGGFTDGMTHGDPDRGGRHGDDGLKIGRETMSPVTDFIDGAVAEGKPFLLWYAPFLPHTPHNPPKKLLDKYRKPGRPENVARYFAMCEWFDQTCGTLLDHIDDVGVRENTIVVYLCDNGWAPVGRGAAKSPDKTLEEWWPDYAPRSKGSPYEVGIRTPVMVSWPAQVRPEWADDLVSSVDLMPTILTACGLEAPSGLPGIDLLDLPSRKERDAVFGGVWSVHNSNPGDPQSTLQYRWCIQDRWKLLLRHPGEDTTRYRVVHQWDTEPRQLFDLGADPQEAKNIAEAHPGIVEQLTRRMDAAIPVQ